MRVSVCMPCFNASHYIDSALHSVLNQSYRNFEIIVVDDGSTDRSRFILRNYKSRITLIEQENRGAAAARNAAFRSSQGEAILFLDADDLISADHILSLVEKLSNDATIASSRWARFIHDPVTAKFDEDYITDEVSGIEWLVKAWSESLPNMLSGMFLIPRELIVKCGGWDERLSLIDDFEFYARIIAACECVRFAPDARLYYRSGIPGSLSGQKSRKAVESQFLSLSLGTGHLLKTKDDPHTRRACANVLQAFEYEHFPNHPDLRAKIRVRVAELGGADIIPSGPPGFQKLRRWIGWKAARRVQRTAERFGLNGAARH
jgi:glycosyltransferase involved in cell wall biosynthesis